jgi:hypothetical protein
MKEESEGTMSTVNDKPEPDVSMEDMFRIMKEVAIGQKSQTPDTPAQAAFRAEMQRDKEQARARGEIFDIPGDWAD